MPSMKFFAEIAAVAREFPALCLLQAEAQLLVERPARFPAPSRRLVQIPPDCVVSVNSWA